MTDEPRHTPNVYSSDVERTLDDTERRIAELMCEAAELARSMVVLRAGMRDALSRVAALEAEQLQDGQGAP